VGAVDDGVGVEHDEVGVAAGGEASAPASLNIAAGIPVILPMAVSSGNRPSSRA
jgi:hypothetical protein